MNTIVIILLSIVGLIILLLVIGLFSKTESTIRRTIIINKPSDVIFAYARYLKNQDHFNKWVMMDPQMKKEFRGTDGAVGFVYAWDSTDKTAGKGEQEITGITEGKRVDMQIRFEKPFKNISETFIETENINDNQSKVTWSFWSKYKYPMNIMLLFINFDKLLGKDMEESLNNLKKNLESNG